MHAAISNYFDVVLFNAAFKRRYFVAEAIGLTPFADRKLKRIEIADDFVNCAGEGDAGF